MIDPAPALEQLVFEIHADISEVLGFIKAYVNGGGGGPAVTQLIQSGDLTAWHLWLHLGSGMKPKEPDDSRGPLWEGELLRIVLVRYVGNLTALKFDFSSEAVIDFIQGLAACRRGHFAAG